MALIEKICFHKKRNSPKNATVIGTSNAQAYITGVSTSWEFDTGASSISYDLGQFEELQ